jgi:hypothetical protein
MSHRARCGTLGVLAMILATNATPASAGGWFKRRAATRVTTAAEVAPTSYYNPANANAPSPMLGTFYPTPYIVVSGTGPTGSGYSPLGQYGLNNLQTYGPTSAFRAKAAPVRIYSRGYDGVVREVEGTSFSTPFYPPGSPVIYPTPASDYYRPRGRTSLPSRFGAEGWVDQN